MDEPKDKRSSWLPILAVLLIAMSVRLVVVARSEVAARDSIGFIGYALDFESKPFARVLREAQQPPGYPLAVMVVSWPVRAWQGGTTTEAMTLAAQLASAFFGAMLVLPMVWLGDELIDRRIGLLAAGLFSCMPAWVRITSDGLSESTFLFWSATTLWLAARSLRTGSIATMLAAGLMAGCSYFTRPEGAELVAATGLALAAAVALGRVARRTGALQAMALAVGFAAFLGPFFAATGRLTNKPTARYLMGDPTAKQSFMSRAPTAALPLAVWWSESDDPSRNRLLWGARALVEETAASARIVGLFVAAIGFMAWRKRVRSGPGAWAFVLLAVMHSLLLIKMSSTIGYLSERHVALIVLTGCYPVALGLERIVEWVCARTSRPQWTGCTLLAVAIFAFASALPSLAKPLHGNRAGHKAAGLWIAANAPPTAGVCDPFCWAQYYAGRTLHETAGHDPNEQFVIVEASDNQHSRLPLVPEAKAKAAAGELVFQWPVNAPANKVQVRVYRWYRDASQRAEQNYGHR